MGTPHGLFSLKFQRFFAEQSHRFKPATDRMCENKIRASEIGSHALTSEIKRAEAKKQPRELPDPMHPYRDYMKRNRSAPTVQGGEASWGSNARGY